jgi:citrate synthase
VVPESDVEQGENAAAQFLIRWRGEADPKHVTAVDTYWVSAAEHGLNASTFTARIAASTGADCAAAMSSAVGALSGPLHGGAPTRVLKMLDEVEARGDADEYVRELLARGERIMGFGHRVYRAEDPRARVLRRTARELGSPRVEVAENLERAAIEALREAHPDRPLETNVEFWAAVVLEIAEVPPAMYPALFACARVAGWSAHIVEQRRTGRLIRPSARYVGVPAHSLAETT